MTSSVRVAAHCVKNKEVVITVTNGNVFVQEEILQNGEITEILIHDDLAVSVKERVKEEEAPAAE